VCVVIICKAWIRLNYVAYEIVLSNVGSILLACVTKNHIFSKKKLLRHMLKHWEAMRKSGDKKRIDISLVIYILARNYNLFMSTGV